MENNVIYQLLIHYSITQYQMSEVASSHTNVEFTDTFTQVQC